MIRFKCSKCGEGMESPESMAGDILECPGCGLHERVPLVPSDSPDPRKQTRNPLKQAWGNIPGPFRTTFYGTLGIFAAIVLIGLLFPLLSSDPYPTSAPPPQTPPADQLYDIIGDEPRPPEEGQLVFEVLSAEPSSEYLTINTKITNNSTQRVYGAKVTCIAQNKDSVDVAFTTNIVLGNWEGTFISPSQSVYYEFMIQVAPALVDHVLFQINKIDWQPL